MFFNEGLNDRFYGNYEVGSYITSDIHVDNILNSYGDECYEHIFFGTDYHLYKYKDDKIIRNPDYDKYIKGQKERVKEDDVFIYLGDLIDDECQIYDKLADELDGAFNGYKIFILGNNDLQPESYYLNKLGFNQVFKAYQWRNFTFSHIPLQKFSTNFNIHGHLHEHEIDGYVYDNIEYQKGKHIRIYNKIQSNCRPISLKEVMNLYNKGAFNFTSKGK